MGKFFTLLEMATTSRKKIVRRLMVSNIPSPKLDTHSAEEQVRSARAHSIGQFKPGPSEKTISLVRKKKLAVAAESFLSTYTSPDLWAKDHGAKPFPNDDWPFPRTKWRPSSDDIENLVFAAALIMEEIDQLLVIKRRIMGLPMNGTEGTDGTYKKSINKK